MKMNKNKIIGLILVLVVLGFTFWWGGNAPGLRGWKIQEKGSVSSSIKNDSNVVPSSKETDKNSLTAEEKLELAAKIAKEQLSDEVIIIEKGSVDYSASEGMEIDDSTGKDKYLTDPVPEGKPVPVEPENVEISSVAHTCFLSVNCNAINSNIKWLDKEKVELVTEDGVIFPLTEVTFYEGESVFNVLQREMKRHKIHMEFENTPMYNSAYIEGINNLYEFDCGELSGWMYKVDEWFPNYGCSRYKLEQGQIIEWVYTCDLGIDVGGYYSTGGE
jgi:predicted DNA-binding antitoxin AbrB/MazE fold protein